MLFDLVLPIYGICYLSRYTVNSIKLATMSIELALDACTLKSSVDCKLIGLSITAPKLAVNSQHFIDILRENSSEEKSFSSPNHRTLQKQQKYVLAHFHSFSHIVFLRLFESMASWKNAA